MPPKKIVVTKKRKKTLSAQKKAVPAEQKESDEGRGEARATGADPGRALPSEEKERPERAKVRAMPAGATQTAKTAQSTPDQVEPDKPRKPIILGRPGAKRREFKFLCNSCGKKIGAPESLAGRMTNCPGCGNEITVPQPAAEPQTPDQRKRGLRYERPKTFKFFCVRCGQSLEAERPLADTQLTCPHCTCTITVPPPPDE